MRIYKNKILALCLFSVTWFSCEKDGDMPTAKIMGDVDLRASESTLILKEEDAVNNGVSFTWNKLEPLWSDTAYKHSDAVGYILQIDKAGNNFAAPEALETSNTEVNYTVGELNDMLIRLGLKPFEPADIEVRIGSSLGPNMEALYSDIITLTVTPYLAEPPYPTLYLVGDATEFDWDNTKATAIFRDEGDPFLYTYTGFLEPGALKFLGYLGQWAPQWGDGGDGNLLFRETETDPDPPAMTIPSAGYYTVQFNFRNLTYSIVPYDESGSTQYTSIGIIGGFNEWADIVPMTPSGKNPHIWSLTYTFLSNTPIKFRIAEGWAVNWGPESNPTATYGKGVQDGLNMEVEAGEYDIYFNDLTGRYVIIKKE